MPVPPILSKLRSLSDEELIREHDEYVTTHTGIYTDVRYYLDELARRESSAQQGAMLGYTKQIRCMTVIVTIATIVNVIIAAALLFRP